MPNSVDMKASFVFWVCWGSFLACTTAQQNVSIPLFMQRLLHEAEKDLSDEYYSHSPMSSFQAIARSIVPFNTELIEDGKVLTVHFKIPNDQWSRNGNHQWWVVLSNAKPISTSAFREISVRLSNGTQDLIENVRNNQSWIYFNITGWSLHNQPSPTSVVRVSVRGNNGVSLHVHDFIKISGIEFGPLMVLAPGNLMQRDLTLRELPRQRREFVQSLMHNLAGCRLQTWTVSPDALGWHWLVYPYALSLNLCVGTCPMPVIHTSFNPSNHALARNIYKTLFDSENTAHHPEVQCVPISYRAMSLLLQTEPGNYTIVTSHDLSASRCGCR